MRNQRLLFKTALSVMLCTTVVSGQEGYFQDEWSPAPDNHLVICKTLAGGGSFYDVSSTGNVIGMESPAGFEHIAVGTISEGYVLCNDGGDLRYDLSSANSGFSAISTCSCPSNTSCTVVRKTADGTMELKQVFTLIASERALKIAMTVKNLTGGVLSKVILRRQVDFDVDGVLFTNNHGASELDAYFAWNDGADSGSEAHMVELRHVKPSLSREAKVNNFESSCIPADVASAFPVTGDFTGTLQYNIGTINAGASKSVTVQYERD